MPFIRSMQILIVIVVVCILIAGSFALGVHYGRGQGDMAQSAQPQTEKTEAVKAIEKIIEESGVVSGTLVAVNNDSIVIDAQMVALNPFEAPQTKRETIRLTSNTKITKRVPESMEKIQKSQEDFIKSIIGATSSTNITPPSTYIETSGSVSDLVTGKVVTINLDKEAQTRTASSIAISQ